MCLNFWESLYFGKGLCDAGQSGSIRIIHSIDNPQAALLVCFYAERCRELKSWFDVLVWSLSINSLTYVQLSYAEKNTCYTPSPENLLAVEACSLGKFFKFPGILILT